MVWTLLAMGLLTDLSVRGVFQHARRLLVGVPIPIRSALCQARQRLGIAPLRSLFQRVVRPLVDDQTPGATLGGLRGKAIDGTRLNVPDTPATSEPSVGRRAVAATELSRRSTKSVSSSWATEPRWLCS